MSILLRMENGTVLDLITIRLEA